MKKLGIILAFFVGMFVRSDAYAAGYRLAKEDWLYYGGVVCGNIKGSWLPGRFDSKGRFITHLQTRKSVLAKAKKAKGKAKKALQKSAKQWATRAASEAPICAAAAASKITPVPTPIVTATPGFSQKREWTVMVYMAADNNLAVAGLQDIDEMEQGGGSSDKVAVVVQAEFNKEYLAQSDINTAADFNRSNYNTFRYEVVKGNSRIGPDGPAADVGNRVMTSPDDLADFISWTKQNYPANRYLLVLWNHGGGFTGLLQDETSTGGDLMTLQGLKQALEKAGKVDVIDFDMCLMAQYETLNAVRGLTDYVVASEETEPSEGDPYNTIIAAMQSNPSMSSAQLSSMIVERFYEFYTNHGSSTTKSAVSMAALDQFDQAINQAADSLAQNMSSLKSDIQTATANAQKYAFPQFKDIKHTFDLLAQVNPATGTVVQPVSSMLSAPQFMVNTRARNGTSTGAKPVDKSTGLAITLPSLVDDDKMSSKGAASFENYQTQMGDHPWVSFLSTYIQGSGSNDMVSLGEDRPEWYLLWQQEALKNGAELDVIILEPSGDIYMPRQGTVSPNGVMTADSRDSQYPFEGYAFRETIQSGRYYMFGLLAEDPKTVKPFSNVAYRISPKNNFSVLYNSSNLPQFSMDKSFWDDPEATWQDIMAGKYTDFRYLANWCFGARCSSSRGTSGGQLPGLTKEQLRVIASIAAQKSETNPNSLGAYIREAKNLNGRSKNSFGRLGTEFFWNRMK